MSTTGGKEANLNYNSYVGGKTFMCFRRRKQSQSARYVVDVAIVYSSNAPPEGYEILEKTVSGEFDANVNRGGSETKLAVKYATLDVDDEKCSGMNHPKYHTEHSVQDIAIFLPNKGEYVSNGFVPVEGNLNKGLASVTVAMALMRGPRLGLCDLPLHTAVRDRYPSNDFKVGEGNTRQATSDAQQATSNKHYCSIAPPRYYSTTNSSSTTPLLEKYTTH